MKDILRECPFCGRRHLIPTTIGKGIFCQCGAYGQVDEESDAYLFPQEAGYALGLDNQYEFIQFPEKYLHIVNGGVILEGNEDDPEPIILLWAKKLP